MSFRRTSARSWITSFGTMLIDWGTSNRWAWVLSAEKVYSTNSDDSSRPVTSTACNWWGLPVSGASASERSSSGLCFSGSAAPGSVPKVGIKVKGNWNIRATATALPHRIECCMVVVLPITRVSPDAINLSIDRKLQRRRCESRRESCFEAVDQENNESDSQMLVILVSIYT